MVVAGRFDKVRPPAASEAVRQDHPGRALRADRRRPHDAGAGAGPAAGAAAGFPDHKPRDATRKMRRRCRRSRPTVSPSTTRSTGPRARPGSILSNSLATNLAMWDAPGARARPLVPGAALRPARPRRDRGAGRPLPLRPADRRRGGADGRARRSKRRISAGCRWAAPPRSGSPSNIRIGSTG